MEGSQWTATEEKVPMRMVPVDSPWMEDTVSCSRISAVRMVRTEGRTFFPSSVSRTPARLRTSRGKPNCSSREVRAWLTADWVRPRSSAARLTLPASKVRRNISYF